MGMVWEAYRKGVPFLGVPRNIPYIIRFCLLLFILCFDCIKMVKIHKCPPPSLIRVSLPVFSQLPEICISCISDLRNVEQISQKDSMK